MNNFATTTSHYSRTKALICCLFGGIFGLHMFYVGRVGKGFLYLFTAGGCLILWFCDIFVILLGRFRDQYGEYLKRW